MNCLKLNMKENPCCTIATKTVWASPFHTFAPNSPPSKWEGEQNKMDEQLKRVDTYLLKSVHVDRIFILFFDKTTVEPWQCLPPNSIWPLPRMQWNRRKKKKREMQTKWEAQAPRSYLISINGFTGDPRDPRKSLRGGFS